MKVSFDGGGQCFLLPQIFLLFICTISVATYKPVVIVHGILDASDTMDFLANYIRKAHPGTDVEVLNLLHGYSSLQPMWYQVEKFGELLRNSSKHNPKGINLIGYSQGGLICRGMLSSIEDHGVDTFVSLSSPQMGQYGDTDYLRLLFPKYVKENIYRLFYTGFGQRFSVGNYWKDPHHIELYHNCSAYLTLLNNETANPKSEIFKTNFLKLKKVVLIGGPQDGVITPWQSSHFGFYDGNETVVEMLNQEVFKADSFGLRTLYKRNSIVTYSVPDVEHLKWHQNTTVFDEYILPHLT